MKFETKVTYDFIQQELPVHAHRVLEVGCGSGELAARLLHDGVSVVAIDSDRDCVAAARQLGVDARNATWPDLEVGCGSGELAARLLHDGVSVVAIDSDRDCVAAARQLGVDARNATWPDF